MHPALKAIYLFMFEESIIDNATADFYFETVMHVLSNPPDKASHEMIKTSIVSHLLQIVANKQTKEGK
jgi:hypothetical protein